MITLATSKTHNIIGVHGCVFNEFRGGQHEQPREYKRYPITGLRHHIFDGFSFRSNFGIKIFLSFFKTYKKPKT